MNARNRKAEQMNSANHQKMSFVFFMFFWGFFYWSAGLLSYIKIFGIS